MQPWQKWMLQATLCLALCSISEGCINSSGAGTAVDHTNQKSEAERRNPIVKKYDLVVAQDGSGNYTAVQDAINAAPGFSREPYVIFVKKGVYKEKVIIPQTKPNLVLIGEDIDKTVITYDDYSGIERPPGHKLDNREIPTVYITANDFRAENITFANSAGTIAQALALYLDGDRAVFRNVKFLGWQDTLRTEGAKKRSYFKGLLH